MSFSGSNYAMMEFSDTTIGNDLTLSFWAKGMGSAGTSTSILEAFDTLGNRVLNIHMPWSDNTMYFDAGGVGGYDRISKAMTTTEIDSNWNHWAYVKKQETGEMFIYKNGSLWASGTNKNRTVGYVHRLLLGTNKNKVYNWKGKIDDFQLFDAALDQATIQTWMHKKPTTEHPNWNHLLVSYDFDNQTWAQDQSSHDYLLMPSEYGMIHFDEYPNAGMEMTQVRPKLSFGQGIVNDAIIETNQTEERLKEPTVVFEQQIQGRHPEITNAFVSILSGSETMYDEQGDTLTSQNYVCSNTLLNDTLIYYLQPFEIVNEVEIGRYITPYGINFDLGPNGFAWIYDVSDYQKYLKDTVDLGAHNTQELLDLKFAFIEGIPPRDVHKRQPIWSEYKSYSYANLSNNVALPEVPIILSDTSQQFKIKTRLTGHGQQGNGGCCEWAPKTHEIKVDGISRFTWDIWQTNECGENPNISQGGTWPYAREGWCPGDQVRENEFELTPYVTPGDTTRLDYVIEAIPSDDQAQGGGNYIVAMDLISYSAPNFQHDAAIADVLNPNNWEYYGKWNPTCSNPRVLIQNTGQEPLTTCKIRCWITEGNWLDYEWSGNLSFLEKAEVEIPVTDFSWWHDQNSTMTFTAQIIEIEATPGLDAYAQNNTKHTKFAAPDVIDGPFYIWFTTNNKANENKYRLEDAAGNILFERNQLQNSTQYKDTFDLPMGCYSIIIEDSDFDGIGFWYSSQVEGETTGQFRIRKVGGTTVENFPADFGRYHRYNFSVGFTLGQHELSLNEKVDIYPNPTGGECMIEASGRVNGKAELMVYDVMGRMVHSETMNATANFAEANPNFSNLKNGRYIVRVVTNEHVFTKEFIKM